tara:strand:+ start:498 stop:692 length:195 start_codon:yes stop_codon:yes gene_type:complete
MSDNKTGEEVFPGYSLEPVAAERAARAQKAFRRVFAALAPRSMFDTEPQQIDRTLPRLADGGER